MHRLKRLVASLALLPILGLFLSHAAHGQIPTTLQSVSPFAIVGFMQSATLDTPNDIFSGGTMTVNGTLITVPRNTLFQFPATGMTWQEMFKLAPAPYGLNAAGGPQSGLALNDTPTPFATYEVTVAGNRVVRSATDDKYIAGLIFISQQSLNTGQGFINAIDYTNGELWVGSTLSAKTGARVRLNTPKGRYGIPHPELDVRFTADEDNPTVSARTGYPMCVPRTDPATTDDALCPKRNRPVDPVTHVFSAEFTMPQSPSGVPAGPPLGPTDPDATQQAPFEIGDYITYAGTLTKDSGACTPTPAKPCQYIAAHTISANLGIFTAPNTMPAYVGIESLLLGVGGNPDPLFPQEAVEKLVITAFSTDPTQLVDMYAVDVDACGNTTDRFYTTADPFGPPIAGLKGRARVRTVIGNFLPASREMRVASRTLTQGLQVDTVLPTAQTYANGLIAGQYHAPNFNFIFPENLVIGGPPVPLPLAEFAFLVDGSGPYFGSGPNASATSYGNMGQLNPWPGLFAPAAQGCNQNGVLLSAPIADAGPAQTIAPKTQGVLNGTASHDTNTPPITPLSYTWVQDAADPQQVALNNNGTATPDFIAPAVATTLHFYLSVGNGFAFSAAAATTVTVVGAAPPVVNAGAAQTVTGGTLVTLSGSATPAGGTFQWAQTGGAPVALTGANTATATFTAPAASATAFQALTFSLSVTNAQGTGSSVTTINVKPIPDTVTITTATWRRQRSRLDITAASSVTNGNPVLTAHIPNHADVVLAFDPAAGTYSVVGVTVNPAPGTITVTSSFGGTKTANVTIR